MKENSLSRERLRALKTFRTVALIAVVLLTQLQLFQSLSTHYGRNVSDGLYNFPMVEDNSSHAMRSVSRRERYFASNQSTGTPNTANSSRRSYLSTVSNDSEKETTLSSETLTLKVDSRSENKKPILFLQVGPYKHATTFLQCSLSMNTYDYLLQDNYFYIGTCACSRRGRSSVRECLGHNDMAIISNDRLNENLLAVLPKLKKEKRNAIVVWEYLSDLPTKSIEKLIDVFKDWEIHVSVFYRPMFESLPSWFAQIQRPSRPFRKRYRVWPNKTEWDATTFRNVTGEPILPFDIFYERRNDFEGRARFLYGLRQLRRLIHPSEDARQRWTRRGIHSVEVVHMKDMISYSETDGESTLSYFVCEILVNATRTCQAARQNLLKTKADKNSANKRFSYNYDMLAIAAKQEGLLERPSGSISRPSAWEAIEKRQSLLNKTDTAFPSTCMPTRSLEKFLNQSITAEQALFRGREAEHRSSFVRAVARKSFCHVDSKAALDEDGWREYFSNLTA